MMAQSAWYDSYPLPKVRIAITGDCNLNCFFCNPLGNDLLKTEVKWSITPSDAGRFVRNLADKGVSEVEISGCEPLLRKDAPMFVKAIAGVKAIKNVTLKTNGTFLKNHADALRKAGLKKLVIGLSSLNFIKYQKITGRDNLYRVLDGLEKSERLKFTDLTINFLVMNGINSDELIDFAMLTKSRPLNVRFIEYHPATTELTPTHERLHLPVQQIKKNIDGFQKLYACEDSIILNGHQRFKFRDAIGTISFMNLNDIIKSRSVPTVSLNSRGELSNSGALGKFTSIAKELRRDSKDSSLSKLLEKQIAQAIGKRKSKTKTVKVSSKGKTRTKAKVKAKKKPARRSSSRTTQRRRSARA